MARLVLAHSPDPDRLLAHAAGPFLVKGRPAGPLPLLAVRQGAVRDEIQDRAAAAGCVGWLGRPLVVFAELPGLLAGDVPALTSIERRLLVESLLAGSGRTLGALAASRDAVTALDALLGDWNAERVAPERVTTALDALGGDEWERVRNAGVAQLYAEYLAWLAANRRTDGRDGLALAAEAIVSSPTDVAARLRLPFRDAGEPRDVVVYGLADLRRGWRSLLDALRAAPFVRELRVCVLDAAGDGADVGSERALIDALRARSPDEEVAVPAGARPSPLAHAAASLYAPPGERLAIAPEERALRALAAPDAARELEEVARRVKALLVDAQVAPHRIAVVARKARPYATRAAETLRRYGVPVTARMRVSLDEVPAVAALLRVYGAAAEGWGARALRLVAESPYFDLDLDARALDAVGRGSAPRSLDGWVEAFALLAERTEGDDVSRARAALAAVERLRAGAAPLSAAMTRGEWIALTLAHLGAGPTGERSADDRVGLWSLARNACRPPGGVDEPLVADAVRGDVEGLRAATGLLAGWRGALASHPAARDERLRVGQWLEELRRELSETEVALWTPQRRGVQVLEATAALGRPYDHVFVVGMSTGAFPAEAPARPLFAEGELAKLTGLGLPVETVSVWFDREAALFRAIASSARNGLHLSYAYADGSGSARLSSTYFDDLAARFRLTSEDAARLDESGSDSLWIERRPGSALGVTGARDARAPHDLLRTAALLWRGEADARVDARRALGHLAAGPQQELVRRVLHAAGTEHARAMLRESEAYRLADRAALATRWNGRIESAALVAELRSRFTDHAWPVTQLEEYGRCGWLFFGKRVLKLDEVEEVDEESDVDGATRGAMLHKCLERIHAELRDLYGDDALTSRVAGAQARKRLAHVLDHAVDRTLAEFEARGAAGPRALRAFRRLELRQTVEAYLEWEIAENEKAQRRATPKRRPVHVELAFGRGGLPAVTLTERRSDGGTPRALRIVGKIDRVDELLDGGAEGQRYVVDHKSGRSSLTPVGLYEDGAILQLPLYMLALEALNEHGRRVWGGAYQLVGDRARTAHLHVGDVKKNGEPTVASQKSERMLSAALDHALAHVDRITGGVFPARVAAKAKTCPTYCAMKDACREYRKEATP